MHVTCTLTTGCRYRILKETCFVIVSFAAVIRVVTQRCVTTLITAAKGDWGMIGVWGMHP